MNERSEKKKTLTIFNPDCNEKDLTKKNKVGRSLELKISKKSSNNGSATTKNDISKPICTQSSHEDIAKVLKTLGGISKNLGYKIPKEDSAKNVRGKKKSIKMMTVKPSNSKEFSSKQPTPVHNVQPGTSATDSSQSTLTQKVAEVLSCVTSKKPLSELNLLKIGKNLASFKNGNTSVPNFPFLSSNNTFPSINFRAHDDKRLPTYLTSNKSSIGEKSRSSEYLKYLNLIKQPSKSLSFDNGQSLKAEKKDSKSKDSRSISRNTSETFIRKVDLTKSQNSSHFRNAPPPYANSFESIDWGKVGFRQSDFTKRLRSCPSGSTQSRLCPHRSQSGSAKLNLNTGTPSCFSSLLPAMGTNNKFCCCDIKNQKRENLNKESKHLSPSADPAGNDSKKPSKVSVRVCHCPHLHTENAIKKICFHNCIPPQNLCSSKIFRVNYLPKDERRKEDQSSESDVKQDEKQIMEGSKTATSVIQGKRENLTKGVNKLISTDIVNKNPRKSTLSFKTSEYNKVISKTSLSNSITEKKEKLKKTRTFPEYTRPNVLLWNKENHVQILGQSNSHGKKGTSEKKSFAETWKHNADSKAIKMVPQAKGSVRRVVRPLSRLRSRESKKVSKDDKALEELAVLEKLFAKLNTVERSLRKQKLADSHHQYRNISKMALKKNKEEEEEESRLSFNQMKSLLLLDSPTEEECRRRRKKLRSAIIRHVQNWIMLDFDEC